MCAFKNSSSRLLSETELDQASGGRTTRGTTFGHCSQCSWSESGSDTAVTAAGHNHEKLNPGHKVTYSKSN